MKNVTTRGTVKVGRWTYPAEQDAQGTIRNEKRDGSGSWVKADAAAFVPDEAPKAATPADPASEVLPSDDYLTLRAVHLAIYNSGIWANKDDLQVNVNGANLTEKRGLEMARKLRDLQLCVEERSSQSDGFKTGEPMWMSTPNWDEVSQDESLALFDAAVPTDVVVKSRAIGTVTNNTHKKPGRSTWKVGTPCPQGHVLRAETLYTMPSGRSQCRVCRGEYPSNI